MNHFLLTKIHYTERYNIIMLFVLELSFHFLKYLCLLFFFFQNCCFRNSNICNGTPSTHDLWMGNQKKKEKEISQKKTYFRSADIITKWLKSINEPYLLVSELSHSQKRSRKFFFWYLLLKYSTKIWSLNVRIYLRENSDTRKTGLNNHTRTHTHTLSLSLAIC